MGRWLGALAHVPVRWRPTELVVRVRRFACTHCQRVWRQDTSRLAGPRARLTLSAVQWGLRALALECMSVSRAAAALGGCPYVVCQAAVGSFVAGWGV